MENCSSVRKIITSILVIGMFLGLVSCGSKEAIHTGATESPESVANNRVLNEKEEDLEDYWSYEEADKYYGELTEKVKKINFQSREWVGHMMEPNLEELLHYLSAYGVKSINGLEKELTYSSDVSKMESDLESIDLIINEPYLKNHYYRLMLPVFSPDVYLRIETQKKSIILYFKDLKVTAVSVNYEGNVPSRKVTRFCIDSVNKPWEDQKLECYIPAKSWKCILVNCRTGESFEYEIDSGNELQDMYDKARNLAANLNVNERKLKVYQCVKNIMELTGKDLEDAKQVYEDICWGIWMNIKSIDSYDPNSGMIVFHGVDDAVYEGHLDRFGDIDEIHQQGGESMFQVAHEEHSTEKRKMSIADLSMINGDE